jgi:hypothetical protein
MFVSGARWAAFARIPPPSEVRANVLYPRERTST